MKFICIIDNTTSSQEFVDAIYTKFGFLKDLTTDSSLEMFVIHDGKALDSDTNLLLQILGTEKQRCPLIVDSKTAKMFPELLKLQSSIVLFEHEQNQQIEINEYHTFNETIATSHGARIDYINHDFHDMENAKMLSVVNIQKHLATIEYYTYLAQIFEQEHNHYPCILLPRSIQQECKNTTELIDAFNKRLELVSHCGWETTAPKEQFDDMQIIMTSCCDMAIHSLADARLHSKTPFITVKKV